MYLSIYLSARCGTPKDISIYLTVTGDPRVLLKVLLMRPLMMLLKVLLRMVRGCLMTPMMKELSCSVGAA